MNVLNWIEELRHFDKAIVIFGCFVQHYLDPRVGDLVALIGC